MNPNRIAARTLLWVSLFAGIAASPLLARHPTVPFIEPEISLVRSENSPHIFWIDRFHIRHHVSSSALLKRFFGSGAPIAEIPHGQLVQFAVGGAITESTPPDLFNSRPDPYLQYEGYPPPASAQPSGRFERSRRPRSYASPRGRPAGEDYSPE